MIPLSDLIEVLDVLGHRGQLAPIEDWCSWTGAQKTRAAVGMMF